MTSIHTTHRARDVVQLASERTILQIEDNQANAEVVNQVLARREDLKLHTAIDGQQGIEMANTLLPDVILLDMKLPDLGGLEVLLSLLRNPATAHIPVVALSSNAYPGEIKQCLSAGFFRYLTKPYKIVDLVSVIDAALRFVDQSQPLHDPDSD